MTGPAAAQRRATTFWHRAISVLREIDEAMHIREADILADRIRRLETDVATLKAVRSSSAKDIAS